MSLFSPYGLTMSLFSHDTWLLSGHLLSYHCVSARIKLQFILSIRQHARNSFHVLQVFIFFMQDGCLYYHSIDIPISLHVDKKKNSGPQEMRTAVLSY